MTNVTAYFDCATRKWVSSTGEWINEASSPQFTAGVYTQLNLTLLNAPSFTGLSFTAMLMSTNTPSGTMLVEDDGINEEGGWSEADEDEGKFSILLDLNTEEVFDALGELVKDRYWFVFAASDGDALVYSFAVPVWVWNNADANNTPTPVESGIVARNLPVTLNASSVTISDLGGRAVNATLESPVGSTENISVANVEVNVGRTEAIVYLTSAVPTTGYILRCILYKVS